MKTEEQKLRALEVNCFSPRNNGGYEDLLNQYDNEESFDEADMHMFIDELADELEAYNEMLDEDSKVNLDRKMAVRVAIRESLRVTYKNPKDLKKRALRTAEYLKNNDPYWTRIMSDENGYYTITFKGESEGLKMA